jgi:hypothetical protein
LAQLFSDRVFRVPDYQRGYAWEPRQLNELLEDLETLPTGKDHYTGTIVLHDQGEAATLTDEAGRVYSLHHIVDGQQRLTTLVILLSAIEQQLHGEPEVEPLVDAIRSTYLRVRDESGQPLYKLTLNDDSKAFFRDEILGNVGLGGPKIASHERLANARDRFQEYLGVERTKRGTAFVVYLRDLHRAVTSQLKWTVYEVESAAEVGVIFEVMNDRGKPLSELDKVKNYLMYVGGKLVDYDHHELDEEINHAWAVLFHELMAAGLSSTQNRGPAASSPLAHGV